MRLKTISSLFAASLLLVQIATAQTATSKQNVATAATPNTTTSSSQITPNWSVNFNSQPRFIENKGQFDQRDHLKGADILYGVDFRNWQIYFTKQGLTYRFDKKTLKSEMEEWAERKEQANEREHEHGKDRDRDEKEEDEHRLSIESNFVHMFWQGANPNVEVVAEDEATDYNTFCMVNKKSGEYYQVGNVKGFKKLVYKNIYPNIDVEYTFHPESGIEYTLILHPGADLSKINMKYGKEGNISINDAGELYIVTSLGTAMEHPPVAFYADNKSSNIDAKFVLKGRNVSFNLGNYDLNKTLVIDPWVQSPTLANSNCVWECDHDASGNIYVIGGDVPMKLQKYNSTGTLQWTYNTPWDTTNGDWLGGMATDANGNSYVTRGSSAAIQKINSSGSLVWSKNGSTNDEYWTIAFNCDQTKLIIGGTRLGLLPPANSFGVIFDINTANGNVSNVDKVSSGSSNALVLLNEVRAITSSHNAKYYYLSLDTIGAISQDFNLCSNNGILFKTNSGYNFGYKCENFRPSNGNAGIQAIRANDKFVYTQNGTSVQKRSLITGAVLATATIPGGQSLSSLGLYQPDNSGIDIDSCGNVFVGSSTGLVEYDANLNQITTVSTPYRVFDVTVSTGGNVIVSGGTGTSSSSTRTGYVQSFNMGSCTPFTLTCCDPTICPAGPFCDNAAAVTLVSATPGGVWAGTGITNASTGVFDPSVAGPGLFTITYTLPCGSDTIFIRVNNCATLTVCSQPNGDYTVTGGTGPYTWQKGVPFTNCSACPFGVCIPPICNGVADTTWTTYATTATATPPGTFPIRVKDSGINTLTIFNAGSIQPCITCPTITTTVSSQTSTSCPGVNNGSATVSASGGVAPYTYTWSPGNLTGATQSGLGAGTYTIAITDANGCTGTFSVTITSGAAAAANVTVTAPTCGNNNGTATANVTAGTAPYTYAWSNSGNTQTISNLAPGSYTVTVTTTGGCTATASGTIVASTAITANVTVTAPTCGASNGTATANVTAGTGPFTYAWSNSGNTQTISNLAPGNYTVTVTGAGGCTATATGTIVTSTAITANVTVTDPTCGGSNGTATANTTAGTGPFTYAWSNSGNTQTISNLAAGSYTVTITGAGGCTATASGTLAASTAVAANVTVTDPTCGASNGSASANTTAGAGPFTYAWSNSGNTQTISNLASGTYTVTVTGAGGCTATASGTLAASAAITANVTVTDPICGASNGSATANTTTGTGPFTYAWSNSGNTQTISNLASGTYTVTVTGAGGCTATASGTLAASTGITANVTATQSTCGQSNGSATANTTAGTGPFTYAWSNSGNTQTISNLAAGNYTVTITGAGGCTATATGAVNSNSTLVLNLTNPVNPTCAGNDGAITVDLSGGTAPYTVTIDTGGTPFTITSPIAVTQTFSGLSAMTINVSVTDANSCQINASATLVAAPGITATITPTDPTCGLNNGSATANAVGGTSPYTYAWSNSGNTQTISSLAPSSYTVTVTGTGGCTGTATATLATSTGITANVTTTQSTCGQSNGSATANTTAGTGPFTYAWSNSGNTQTISNLAAGNYTVTITGAGGCTTTATNAVNSNSSLVLNLTNPVNPTCAGNDGAITVDLSGGTAPYTVTVDTGGTPFTITSPIALSQTFSGLSAMTINVSVTDASGCQANATATLTAATGCCAFTFTTATTQPSCGQSDGSITLTIANGSGNYTYTWSNGVSSGNTASNLAAGTYFVTITDNGFVNCNKFDTITLTNPNAQVIGNIQITNVSCAGDTSGSIAVTVNGGTPPYTYVWTNGQTANPAINLAAGSYDLTVTDASGCVATTTANVTEPLALSVQVNANSPSCTDPNSGSAVAVALGGTTPYGYVWSNAGTTDSISGLSAGPYDVTVTDAAGCTTTGSTTVVGDTVPPINLGLDRTICTGDSVVLDAGSANAVWSTGFTGSTITVHNAGQYWAVVTAGACTNSDTVTIAVSRLPFTPVLNITDSLICDGDPLLLTVSDLGDLYTWSTGDTALEITVDTAGTYIVYAINGCGIDSSLANITSDNCNCILYMPNVFSPNGDGKNDTYRPVTLCDTVQGYVFKIFDRWGDKVYESHSINEAWDGTFKGTLCDPAVFVWNLSYVTHTLTGEVKQYYRKGTVTLLR